MILRERMRNINLIRVGIEPYLLSKRPREHECLRCVLLYFLIDLLFEVDKLLFNFVIHMPLVFEKILREVLFLLLWVIYVLAILTNMVNRTLNHPCACFVDCKGTVTVDLRLCCHLRVVQLITKL